MILASRLPSRSALVRGRLRRLEQVTRGDKRSKSAIVPPFQLISVNSLRRRTKKTWLWVAGSNQNATNTTNQIPRLSNVRVRQTNNGCAQAYFHLCSSFSISGLSSFRLESFLACLNPLSISSSKMAAEQLSLAGYYKHLRKSGPKIAKTFIWEG